MQATHPAQAPATNGSLVSATWRLRFSRAIMDGLTRTADWLIDHWLGLINWFLGSIVVLAILTPILAWLGIEPLAGWIFRTFHSICEQIPSHSVYLFGHQMALCSRNFSLYASLWVGTMIFRFVRQRVKPLNWKLLILFLLPMAIDGVTQMFGLRESNLVLRIITGTLFGTGICWFAMPFVEQSINESNLMPPYHYPTPVPEQTA